MDRFGWNLRCTAAPLFQPNWSNETHVKTNAQSPQSFSEAKVTLAAVRGDSVLA